MNSKISNFQKPLVYIFFAAVILITMVTYGYTQFLKKNIISAVLQNNIDLNNKDSSVFAVTTSDYSLSDGKFLPKGSVLVGMLDKSDVSYAINFNKIIKRSGNKDEQISAKTIISLKSQNQNKGISANIGKTLYKQTKSSVLGAIFYGSQSTAVDLSNQFLSKGTLIKVEID